MEHMAWKGRTKPGCKAEYQRRRRDLAGDGQGFERGRHLQLQHFLLQR